MNERNPHILKTWLAKAVAPADDLVGEKYPCLTWIYGYWENGNWLVSAADGYRVHMTHHFPAKLRKSASKDNGVYVIETSASITDDNGIAKWTRKIADNIKTVSKPVIENYHAMCRVNPVRLMQVAKWAYTHDDFKAIVLSTVALNLEVWGEKHLSVLAAPFQSETFTIMVNPKYLMDALWIHYYKPQVALYVDPTNTVLGVGDPQGNFAVVMAMAGGVRTRPNTMRHTIEISEDVAVTYEV